MWTDIEGWFSEEEGELLASNIPYMANILELGAWKGRSTVLLAQSTKGTVVSIDTFRGSEEHGQCDNYDEFLKNLEREGVMNVRPIRMTSLEAALQFPDQVDVLFIDAAHDFDSVLQDFAIWQKWVPQGGMIAFHDAILSPGVKEVVQNMIFFGNNFRDIRYAGNLVICKKDKPSKVLNCIKWLEWRAYILYSTIYAQFSGN